MPDLSDISVGDTIRGIVSFSAPHPDDPHPENPSRTVRKTRTYEGIVLKIVDGGALIKAGPRNKMRLKAEEIEEVVERADTPAPEPITFEAAGKTWVAEWDLAQERYEVKDTSQFDVWGTDDGNVRRRLDVYKNVDDRIRNDVRTTMNAVADALSATLNA